MYVCIIILIIAFLLKKNPAFYIYWPTNVVIVLIHNKCIIHGQHMSFDLNTHLRVVQYWYH